MLKRNKTCQCCKCKTSYTNPTYTVVGLRETCSRCYVCAMKWPATFQWAVRYLTRMPLLVRLVTRLMTKRTWIEDRERD